MLNVKASCVSGKNGLRSSIVAALAAVADLVEASASLTGPTLLAPPSDRRLLFRMLSRLSIDHGNLLKTRMEITAYNLHGGSFRPSLGLRRTQVYSVLVGSRRCYP